MTTTLIQPLFVSSMETLKDHLRMTGTSSVESSQTIINQAVEQVRVGFFDCLKAHRVNQIRQVPYRSNASDAKGLLRIKANNTEIAWVRSILMRTLPVLFMDASAATREIWNEEGLTRRASGPDLGKEIERLESQVAQWLDELKTGTATCDAVDTVRVSVIEPDDSPQKPGDSVFSALRQKVWISA